MYEAVEMNVQALPRHDAVQADARGAVPCGAGLDRPGIFSASASSREMVFSMWSDITSKRPATRWALASRRPTSWSPARIGRVK
jgi:hypothetical protein